MSIRIEKEKCRSCGQCVEACPGNLLRLGEDRTAISLHPEECWGCAACLKACRFDAIRYFLGADIGGNGSQMYTREDGSLIHWVIERPGQDDLTITVDRRNANQY